MAQKPATPSYLIKEVTEPIQFQLNKIGKCKQVEVTDINNLTPNPPAFRNIINFQLPKNEFNPEMKSLDIVENILKIKTPKSHSQWGRELDYKKTLYQIEPSNQHQTINNEGDSESSTSLLRTPGKFGDFIRGTSRNMPFLPGGMKKKKTENSENNKKDFQFSEDELDFDKIELKKFAPGFSKGLTFDETGQAKLISTTSITVSSPNDAQDQQAESAETETNNQPPKEEYYEDPGNTVRHFYSVFTGEDEDPFLLEEKENKVEAVVEKPKTEEKAPIVVDKENIPRNPENIEDLLEFSTSEADKQMESDSKDGQRRFKQWATELNRDMSDFYEQVPEMAIRYPFELDKFQKEAIYHLERGESVFVAAHTSAGKTVVAEYAIALCKKHMTRAIYTSPIKALSNQKFRDFKETFGEVGLITGDVQVNPEASCLIVTTEILRSMLYKGADLIRDVEWVIFDEVHYINDLQRGVVWEEVIIMLPARVNIILLSATVPNTLEFADWIGRTKKKKIYVVSTFFRPTPLEHYVFSANQFFKIVDKDRNFIAQAYKDADLALKEKSKKANKKHGNQSSYSKPGSERTHWTKFIQTLEKKNLTPTVVFAFSKKKCDQLAYDLTSIDMTTSNEKYEIHKFILSCISKLNESDRKLPQVLAIKEILSRGIGVHHSGLLPIIKEMVEILFGRGLCKLLFATETFAMGVNMPARTVVFNSIRKHDGQQFRNLLSGEYIQMSGRAGRRGIDSVGMVIIVAWDELPDKLEVHSMILGTVDRLESKFRLTYGMILNLLRVQDFRVEDMIMRSFFEVKKQIEAPQSKSQLKQVEAKLGDIEEINCIFGTPEEIYHYYQLHADAKLIAHDTQGEIARNKNALKFYALGRVIQISVSGYRNNFAIILRKSSSSNQTGTPQQQQKEEQNGTIYFDIILPTVSKKIKDANQLHEFQIIKIPLTGIINLFKAKINMDEKQVNNLTCGNFDNSIPVSKAVDELLSYAEKYKANPESLPLLTAKDLKIASLDFVTKQQERATKIKQLSQNPCHNCNKLNEHFLMMDKQQRLMFHYNRLKHELSENNLLLMPEFHVRTGILQRLGYIDENKAVQLKGRVARELNTIEDELIGTELIFENKLTHLQPEEIVAVLSCLIFQERNASDPTLTPVLQNSYNELCTLAEGLGKIQAEEGLMDISPSEYSRQINYRLMEVVYEWARGMPFADICNLTDVPEGSIVRSIVRLEETCREVKSAARIIGDVTLYSKLETASQMIKRDIVFASSLYVA